MDGKSAPVNGMRMQQRWCKLMNVERRWSVATWSPTLALLHGYVIVRWWLRCVARCVVSFRCICIVRQTKRTVNAFKSTGNSMAGFGVFTPSRDSTTFHWHYMLSLSMDVVSLFFTLSKVNDVHIVYLPFKITFALAGASHYIFHMRNGLYRFRNGWMVQNTQERQWQWQWQLQNFYDTEWTTAIVFICLVVDHTTSNWINYNQRVDVNTEETSLCQRCWMPLERLWMFTNAVFGVFGQRNIASP